MPFHYHHFQVRIHAWPAKSYHHFDKTKNNIYKHYGPNNNINVISNK